MKYKKASVDILIQGRHQGLTHKDLFDTASMMILTLAQIMQLNEEGLKRRFEDILEAFREPIPEELLEGLYRQYLEDEG
jgi:hypothetical protein